MSRLVPGEMSSDEESGSGVETSVDGFDDVNSSKSQGFLAGCTPAFLMTEALCGITVALAMVPEAVAFSLSAGLKPKVGLLSTFFISLFTSLFGGRPAMASGATGSIAVLLSPILASHGKEYMFYAVILMGIFEIVLGLIGVGNLVRLVPIPVEIGFCNGLALVIAFAQLNSFKMPEEPSAGRLLSEVPEAFSPLVDGKPWVAGESAIFFCVIVVTAFLVCIFLPKLTERVPAALAAIAVGTAIEWGVVRAIFHSSTTLIIDLGSAGGSFPVPIWFDSEYHMPPVNGETFGAVLSLAITMTAIGMLESCMTLTVVDEITKSKGNVVQECVGQGVANIVCGAFGGMGGCAMLGQSIINVSSGARGRASMFFCSVFVLFILLVAYPVINILPVAALTGVMFNVVYRTMVWSSLKLMVVALLPLRLRNRCLRAEGSRAKKVPRADAFVIMVVTVMTLLTDLAKAVVCGVAVSIVMYVYESAEFISVAPRERSSADEPKIYDVHGVLFFGSASRFLECFNVEKDPEKVRLVFESSYVSDYSALEALNKLGERYHACGKHLTLELLHPNNSKIIDKAQKLLGKEIGVEIDGAPVLPMVSEPHRIEGYGTTNSFLLSRAADAAASLSGPIIRRQGRTSTV